MLWLLFLLICTRQTSVPTWQIYTFAKVMNQSKKVKAAIILKPKVIDYSSGFFFRVQMAGSAVFHLNTVGM